MGKCRVFLRGNIRSAHYRRQIPINIADYGTVVFLSEKTHVFIEALGLCQVSDSDFGYYFPLFMEFFKIHFFMCGNYAMTVRVGAWTATKLIAEHYR